MALDLENLSNFLGKDWHKISSLIAVEVAFLVLTTLLLELFDLTDDVKAIFLSSTVFLILFTWLFTRNRVQKSKKNKIGFIVAICDYSDNENQNLKYFKRRLERLIKGSSSNKLFHFIEYPDHISRNINSKADAKEYLSLSRSRFMIYGKAIQGALDSNQSAELEINGLVSHKRIDKKEHRFFEEEFSELFPRSLTFNEDNNLYQIKLNTTIAEIISKYIIANAMGYSQLWDLSLTFFMEVIDKIEKADYESEIFEKVKDRSQKRIAGIYKVRASLAYSDWFESISNERVINEMGFWIDKIEDKFFVLPDFGILKAIHLFLSERNTNDAKAILKNIKSPKDKSHVFSLAFLEAYEGNLDDAQRYYSLIENMNMSYVNSWFFNEIDEFICKILDMEPEKKQLHFILGLFNMNFKEDKKRAIKEFESFINSDISAKYSHQIRISSGNLKILRKSINN